MVRAPPSNLAIGAQFLAPFLASRASARVSGALAHGPHARRLRVRAVGGEGINERLGAVHRVRVQIFSVFRSAEISLKFHENENGPAEPPIISLKFSVKLMRL